MNFHHRHRHRSPAYRLLAVVLFISALAHIPILALLPTLTNSSDDTFDPATFNKPDDFSIQLVNEEPRDSKQYVQLPAPEREETPDKADFEAQHAQKVDRQTVRRAPAAPLPVAAVRPATRPERSAEKPPIPEHILPPRTPEKTVESSENPETIEETIDDTTEPDLGPLRRPTLDVPAPPQQEESSEPPRLFPTLDDPFAAQQTAAGGHDNHVPDVEEGAQTLLNRQRTRYWAFFDRIVNQVRDNWNGTDVYQRHDPDGTIYGVKDRATTLRIALRGDGSIHNIWISSSSGLNHLDQEAIRAMRAAAPFYNPPEALKDNDGLVMFSFTFYIEIRADDSRRMRIRWRP